MNKKYALITGASKGIGKDIAIELAKRGINLVLVARSENELAALNQELIEEYKIASSYKAMDLMIPGAVENLFAWCKENDLPVFMLINNAGFGSWGGVADVSLEDQEGQMYLNQQVLVQACKVFLPMLQANAASYILNVASTAAYQPMPYFGIYAATKAFVLSYSRAIRYELKPMNISVSALCPGPTHSAFFDRSGFDPVAAAGEGFMMRSEVVARLAVKGLLAKKAVIITGFTNKLSVFFSKHLPGSWTSWMIAKVFGPK